MKELSIFVDESGDFGEYDFHSPFYIISLVFHNQDNDIHEDLDILENQLSNIGYSNHCTHAGPLIRGEEEYRNEDIKIRQKIMRTLITFIKHLNIQCKSIYIEKKHIDDSIEAAGKLSKQLSSLIKDNLELFSSFDVVKVYYDNGQVEVNRILSSVFNALLDNVEFRRVLPSDYRLFQVADLICTLKLEELKFANHISSKSENKFFENERTLKKTYLKSIQKKIFVD